MSNNTPERVGVSTSRLQKVDALLQGYVERGEIPGFLATIALRGKTIYKNRFGLANIEEEKPMQYDTIFRIASMTKPVTSVAAMMLYENGHFTLNTPVSEFIPAFKELKVLAGESNNELILTDLEQEITIRHLFTHTAGLSYGFQELDKVDHLYLEKIQTGMDSGEIHSLQSLVDSILDLPLAFQPGTQWRYSVAIDVIGRIIEIISGMTLDQFLEEHIFAPLGMEETAFYVPQSELHRLIPVYKNAEDGHGKVQLKIPSDSVDKADYVSGGSGLYSTLDDYGRFAQFLVNGGNLNNVRLLSPTTVALMEMNHAPLEALPYGFAENDRFHAGYGYGLGMRVLMDVSQSGQVGSPGEFGWDGAYSTYFWIDRKEALYGLLLMQHFPNHYYPLQLQFKALTYQALTD
jgi:CubicO group peptidase (beta-lactamase class C family)